MDEFPRIISVDDHIVEPPDLWQERLPAAMKDKAPKVIFAPKGDVKFVGGKLTVNMGEPGSGEDVAWWIYEDLKRPLMRLDASVGFDRDEVDLRLVNYDQMRKGAWSVKERLEDMDANWTDAQMCFPTFPRFCGQTFYEAKDKDVALECVKAYNDFLGVAIAPDGWVWGSFNQDCGKSYDSPGCAKQHNHTAGYAASLR